MKNYQENATGKKHCSTQESLRPKTLKYSLKEHSREDSYKCPPAIQTVTGTVLINRSISS
jgi:hypothetical protein